MKIDVPETEAWRRKRAEELGVVAFDPWAIPHPRNNRADVAPMRVPADMPRPEPAAEQRTPRVPLPASDRPRRQPPAPAPVVAAKSGGAAMASAVTAGLLLAVAAGWQARDLLDPTAAPPSPPQAAPRPVPRAAPVVAPAPLPARCDSPGVVAALQNRITAAVAGEGGDPAWSARVAAEARVQVAPPSVTNVTATGARFCGTTLTVQPPGEAQPQTAAITYFVTPSGAVGDVQGDVALTRRIAAMGRPAPAPARRTATSVKPQAAKATDPAPASRLPEVATKRPQVVPSAPPKAVGAPVSLLPPSVTPRREPRDDAPVAACADVWSRAEAMICATPALKAQHRALTATLDRILLSGEAYTIKRAIDGQRRFLARRDNCKDAACIARRYDDRLTDLARIEAKGNVR